MRTIEFGPDTGRQIDRHGSDFHISRLIHSEVLHVGCIRLEPGGSIGLHPATTHQLFAVVRGTGWVQGAEGSRIPIGAGQAALWEPGEEHAAGTDGGMIAIVVEGDAVAAGADQIGLISIQPDGGTIDS